MLVLTVLSYTSVGNQFKEHNFVKTAGQLLLSFCIAQTQCKCQRSQTVYSVQVFLKWTNLHCHKTLPVQGLKPTWGLWIIRYAVVHYYKPMISTFF